MTYSAEVYVPLGTVINTLVIQRNLNDDVLKKIHNDTYIWRIEDVDEPRRIVSFLLVRRNKNFKSRNHRINITTTFGSSTVSAHIPYNVNNMFIFNKYICIQSDSYVQCTYNAQNTFPIHVQ